MNQPSERSAKKRRVYSKSEAFLDEALQLIPGGTQTFSKSRTQYPVGAAPLYASRAKGSHLWDVDDNKYIDFVSGLLSISLGYNDPDVTAAVQGQLMQGVSFSLPSTIEIDVARQVVDMVPCAEMVRFGKNGSDATAGAVRIARAFTGREHILMCGYHGWHEWSVATTNRDKGIPGAIGKLSHTFRYNDLGSLDDQLKAQQGKVAAVILEAANVELPDVGFLKGVKERCEEHGALLVFDEIITGFRYANGGAQEFFGVTPDLCTLGKGMANGFPLSAICGRGDVMREMENVFFSSTFGSEALSLAAAHATLEKIRKFPVTKTIADHGQDLMARTRDLLSKHEMASFMSVSGHPSWSFLVFKNVQPYSSWEIRTLWMQECFERGILGLGTHNLNFAHNASDIDQIIGVYDVVFPMLKDAVTAGTLGEQLRCDPIEPLFQVRPQ